MSGDDIVVRLRSAFAAWGLRSLGDEAADEIACLRAAVQAHHDTKHGTGYPAAVLSPPDITLYAAVGIEHRTLDVDTLDARRRAPTQVTEITECFVTK